MKFWLLLSALLFSNSALAARAYTESTIIEKTVTTSTSAYASGDQIGTILSLPYAVDGASRTAFLTSVTVIDKDKQKPEIDLFLFSESPTVTSVDNGAFSLSDTELANKGLGVVTIAATDYKDTALNSIATVDGLAQIVKSIEGSVTVYVIPVIRGAATYTSTTNLVIKVGLAKD